MLSAPNSATLNRGVENTGLPYRFEQLADMMLAEDGTNSRTLGSCVEFVIEHSLLSELFGLCAADEPTGVMRELVFMCARLVHGMGDHFLAHKGNAHAITQLIHHGMTRREVPNGALAHGELSVADTLLLLIHELMCRLAGYPQLLFLYLELSPSSSREDGHLQLLTFLCSHVLAPAWAGFYARGALVVLVRQLARQSRDGEKESLSYLVGAGLPEALTAAVSAAYGLLPTQIKLESHPIEGLPAHIHATRRWSAAAFNTLSFFPPSSALQLCVFLDTLWLTEQALKSCSISCAADIQDMLEQLRIDMIHTIRTSFVERVLVPAAGSASMSDQSASAAIFYHACILEVLDTTGELAAAICQRTSDERGIYDLVCDVIPSNASLRLRSLVYRAAVLHASCIAAAEASVAPAFIPPMDDWSLAVLGSLVHTLQSPHFCIGLVSRYYAHMDSVAQKYNQENVCRAYPIGDSRIAFRHRAQVRINQEDYFLTELLERLCRFYSLSPAENIITVDAISSLCYTMSLSVDGLLGGPRPIITFVLYMLSLQAQAYMRDVPDLAFFLGQRKNKSSALRVSSRQKAPQASRTLEIPFIRARLVDDALNQLESEYSTAGWLPSRNVLEGMSRSSTYTASDAPSTSGEPQLNVELHPIAAPADGPWASIRVGTGSVVHLSDLLDNIILLEETMIELVCILQLRRSSGTDAYNS